MMQHDGVMTFLVELAITPFVLLGLVIAWVVWLRNQRRKEIQTRAVEVQRCADAAISQHLDTLVRRRSQLVYRDDFGREVTKKWDRELAEFVRFHVLPVIPEHSRATMAAQVTKLAEAIANKVKVESTQRPITAFVFSASMSPHDFESFCAERLVAIGWDARLTQASGDQGSDVIATKNGVKVVVQCKLYSRPVGNKAVQEISAARLHESAQYAAVVSNQTYTSAARRLAETNRVALLHFSELTDKNLMGKA